MLRPGDSVLLFRKGQKFEGVVDAVSVDGSLIWLQLANAGGRKLFHHIDGYETLLDACHGQ